tara:strand:- start:407 stop:676 length:270 start_codon:yes stop_codon:yes gene_type:complete
MSYLELSSDYEIEYEDNKGIRTKRIISPIRQFDYRGLQYLEAYCHMRKENRSFKLEGIKYNVKLGPKSENRLPLNNEENWPTYSSEETP